MDSSQITLIGALVLGMVTSLHCVGMCGPIACGLSSLAKSDTQRLTGTALYHSGRVLSYGLIGAICGAVGRAPLEWFFKSPAVVLPWVLVAVLLMMGLGIDKLIPQPAFVARLTTRARFKAMRLSPPAASAAMGLLSPFLPCAPLYAVFLATLTASSAVRGAELLVAFALGTVPLLWVAHHPAPMVWRGAAAGRRRGRTHSAVLLPLIVAEGIEALSPRAPCGWIEKVGPKGCHCGRFFVMPFRPLILPAAPAVPPYLLALLSPPILPALPGEAALAGP
ncbi:MAG: sulfite exporter TauE/SafE family protein [Akkermansiaceae bacterium]|nr:sulfite exporter TauE/SafE family protein [Akkermansiaceae bacterium]